LLKCQFTSQYDDYEIGKYVDFHCQELPLASGFCIFHDKNYLHDKTNYEEHKRKVLDRLKHKVNHAISNNEPLRCIGFHLPDFSLSDLSISKEFTKPVYFSGSQFFGKADFSEADFQGRVYFNVADFQGRVYFNVANFQGEANFSRANFQERAYFTNSEFYGKTYFSGHFNSKTEFHYVLFEGKEKVIFEIENLSNVSFMNTDLTGVRFSDKARWGEIKYGKFWGGKKVKEERFKIIDERLLEKEIENKDGHRKDFNLDSIKAVYRNLRENYEYRMRWDEAGQFFIREMELKRKYRECPSKEEADRIEIKQNGWFRRNLIHLTGWYYHLSRYGKVYGDLQ
jgi:hypothetical protein